MALVRIEHNAVDGGRDVPAAGSSDLARPPHRILPSEQEIALRHGQIEIARLQGENATLKKELLARGLPVPGVSGPSGAKPGEPEL